MYKRLAFCVGTLMLALQGKPALADDELLPYTELICTSPQNAAIAANALKSLFMMDTSALVTTTSLRKKKQCWYDIVDIPKKHKILSRVYLQEESAVAYIIIPLKIRGVQRYIVCYEEGGPMYHA